jgi:hypothetical protein
MKNKLNTKRTPVVGSIAGFDSPAVSSKRVRKSRKATADVKMAQANDQTPVVVETPVATKEVPAASQPQSVKATVVAAGHNLRKLAGKPSIATQKRVFGAAGYAASWVNRAARLGMPPEALAELFAANPDEVQKRWKALSDKK